MQSYPVARRTRFSPGASLAVFGLIVAMITLPILSSLSTSRNAGFGNAPAVASALRQLPLAFIPAGQTQAGAGSQGDLRGCPVP